MSFIRALRVRPALEEGIDELEELRLIRLFKDDGDQDALRRLIECHRSLINGCIKRLGLSQGVIRNIRDDLVNEGVLGLIAAIRNFDEARGRRLSALAKFYVKAHMTEFAVANLSAVSPINSRGQRAAFFHMRRLPSPDVSEEETRRIAERLGVDVSDVRFVASRLSGGDMPLDGMVDRDGGARRLDETLADETPHQEQSLIERDEREDWSRRMRSAMTLLEERERDILFCRRLIDPPTSIRELAERYGISNGRVTQIEQQAFARLKALVGSDDRADAPAPSPARSRLLHVRIVR